MKKWKTLAIMAVLTLVISGVVPLAIADTVSNSNSEGNIEGYVTNENKSPIENVKISIVDLRQKNSYTTYTDSNGYYKITVATNIGRGRYYAIYAEREDYIPGQRVVCVYPGKTTRADIVLADATKTGWIAGYTLNLKGEPLEGVAVMAMAFSSIPVGNYDTSDSSGYFNLTLLGNEWYLVEAAVMIAPGIAFQTMDYVYVFEGETTFVNLSFPKPVAMEVATAQALAKLQKTFFITIMTNKKLRETYLSTEVSDEIARDTDKLTVSTKSKPSYQTCKQTPSTINLDTATTPNAEPAPAVTTNPNAQSNLVVKNPSITTNPVIARLFETISNQISSYSNNVETTPSTTPNAQPNPSTTPSEAMQAEPADISNTVSEEQETSNC